MSANVNPKTGIRYGIISAHSLDPEVIDDIQREGTDIYYNEAVTELRDTVKRACEDYMSERDADDVADEAVERMSENFEPDEPVHEFELDGVKGRTTWLGGALMVWVFESPFTGKFKLCSPCVPNCCDADNPDPDGYEGYTVPEDWLYKEIT